jgi:hypothetical protein
MKLKMKIILVRKATQVIQHSRVIVLYGHKEDRRSETPAPCSLVTDECGSDAELKISKVGSKINASDLYLLGTRLEFQPGTPDIFRGFLDPSVTFRHSTFV